MRPHKIYCCSDDDDDEAALSLPSTQHVGEESRRVRGEESKEVGGLREPACWVGEESELGGR